MRGTVSADEDIDMDSNIMLSRPRLKMNKILFSICFGSRLDMRECSFDSYLLNGISTRIICVGFPNLYYFN
jgi:hypothetical protein